MSIRTGAVQYFIWDFDPCRYIYIPNYVYTEASTIHSYI